MLGEAFRIIDISQPVASETACFPGDTAFQKQVMLSYAESGVVNLTALTMSPHVGTHADAPIHIYGEMKGAPDTIGAMPLAPYIGPAVVVDVSPRTEAIEVDTVGPALEAMSVFPQRVLFKTAQTIRYDVFEEAYAWFSPELVTYLAERGVVLMGIDTPSVDHIHSKTLPAHHMLHQAGMAWLENLDLTAAAPGAYFLVAPPLKLMELEASPVRAVLLKPTST